jgi:putative colanic acid biosynthesis acetyltransferase WcaF
MENKSILDLNSYNHSFSLKNKSTRLFKKWRVLLLKCFGAKIEWSSHVYASANIWAPWNLEMGANATLGPQVDCYNQGYISIGSNTIISQKTYLCASTHDYSQFNFPLLLKPIKIGRGVWIAADAFVGPGVSIGDNSVIAARSVVIKNIDSNAIVGGNPAKHIKFRTIEKELVS